MKHTPAPWTIVDSDFVLSNDIQIVSNNTNVCFVYDIEDKDKEREANARLICAAPKLLELLQEVMDSGLLMDEPLKNEIKKAIKHLA
jgi:hypothetical protein